MWRGGKRLEALGARDSFVFFGGWSWVRVAGFWWALAGKGLVVFGGRV
ncbi:hypothetical protein [Helicobacter bizzozeronii]|nr:hypothetical protein [Helicobacter bizzozeronii]